MACGGIEYRLVIHENVGVNAQRAALLTFPMNPHSHLGNARAYVSITCCQGVTGRLVETVRARKWRAPIKRWKVSAVFSGTVGRVSSWPCVPPTGNRMLTLVWRSSRSFTALSTLSKKINHTYISRALRREKATRGFTFCARVFGETSTAHVTHHHREPYSGQTDRERIQSFPRSAVRSHDNLHLTTHPLPDAALEKTLDSTCVPKLPLSGSRLTLLKNLSYN